MERKIVKVGNSLGIIIPSVYLEELGVGHKDPVEIDFIKELNTVTIKNKETTTLNENHLEQVVRRAVDRYLREKGI